MLFRIPSRIPIEFCLTVFWFVLGLIRRRSELGLCYTMEVIQLCKQSPSDSIIQPKL